MTFKAAACPNCSAAIQVPDDKTTVKCIYCSSQIVVRETLPAVATSVPPTVIYQTVPVVQANQYHCPLCGSPHPPQIVKRVSSLGWVVFCFGLLFFIIGCLIGLLFKKEVRVCPSCKGTLPPLGLQAAVGASSVHYPGQFDAPKPTPRWVWIVGGIFALGLISAAVKEQQKNSSTSSSSTPVSSSTAPVSKDSSSADRLAGAKASLADKQFADARRNLEAIKPTDKEYAEAQALLEVVKRREAKARR